VQQKGGATGCGLNKVSIEAPPQWQAGLKVKLVQVPFARTVAVFPILADVVEVRKALSTSTGSAKIGKTAIHANVSRYCRCLNDS